MRALCAVNSPWSEGSAETASARSSALFFRGQHLNQPGFTAIDVPEIRGFGITGDVLNGSIREDHPIPMPVIGP